MQKIFSATALVASLLLACDDGPMTPDAGRTCSDDTTMCSAAGATCGRLDLEDGTCVNCGRCQLPEICGGAGQANVCGCTPMSCAELGIECGVADNGCGSMMDCGDTCAAPETCGGGGTPNLCGRELGPEESCANPGDACAAGLDCCDVRGQRLCVEGSGLACRPLADIVVSSSVTANSVTIERRTFGPLDCAVQAQCVTSTGTRRLLRFSTQVNNIGDNHLNLGSYGDNPNYVYDPCHDHYHFDDFITYKLLAQDGSVAAGGFKFSYCLEDVVLVDRSLPGATDNRMFECSERDPNSVQGLQIGWGDLYDVSLDCQWVDITGVTPGDYTLELTVNPDRKFPESRYLNNAMQLPVTITPP